MAWEDCWQAEREGYWQAEEYWGEALEAVSPRQGVPAQCSMAGSEQQGWYQGHNNIDALAGDRHY